MWRNHTLEICHQQTFGKGNPSWSYSDVSLHMRGAEFMTLGRLSFSFTLVCLPPPAPPTPGVGINSFAATLHSGAYGHFSGRNNTEWQPSPKLELTEFAPITETPPSSTFIQFYNRMLDPSTYFNWKPFRPNHSCPTPNWSPTPQTACSNRVSNSYIPFWSRYPATTQTSSRCSTDSPASHHETLHRSNISTTFPVWPSISLTLSDHPVLQLTL